MNRDDRELLAELMSVNDAVPGVTLAILDGNFSRDQHTRFGQRLVALGDAMCARGRREPTLVVDGEVA